MTRAKNTPVTRRRRKKVLKQAKGFYGSKRKLFKTAQEQLRRSWVAAYRGRKERKRFFRRLWITRLNAFCREKGSKYSSLVNLLKLKTIKLNSKQLAEMAIHRPELLNRLLTENFQPTET